MSQIISNHKIYENLKMYFPYVFKNAVNYYEVGLFDLIVELVDGSSIIYDDFEKTVRPLPRDSNNMSEEECRKEFGLRLRQMLYRKGITQMAFAEMSGISQVMISKYINGKASPSLYAIDKIAKVLGCSVDELRYVR